MDYLDLDLGNNTLDAEQIRQEGRDTMQAEAPAGFRINLWLDLLLGACARMVVLLFTLSGQVPKQIFKWFLINILGLVQNAATYASATVRVNANVAAGGTLLAGASVVIDGQPFITVTDITLAAGATGTVAVQAQNPGSDSSGLTGVTVALSAPSVTWVDSVTLTAPTAGGADGESDDDFVNRGADETPTLSAKAIVEDDVAPILRADPEVYRVMVRNLFDGTRTVNGAVFAAGMTDTGTDISTPGKARMRATLEDGRILQIAAYIADVNRNAFDVSYSLLVRTGADTATVRAAADAALMTYLSALGWGIPDGGRPTDFEYNNLVRRNDLFGVLYKVTDVEHVLDVRLALHGNALGTADITMTGAAPVPTLASGNITSTVA